MRPYTGIQHFIFASKFHQNKLNGRNGRFPAQNFVFWGENCPTRTKLSYRLKFREGCNCPHAPFTYIGLPRRQCCSTFFWEHFYCVFQDNNAPVHRARCSGYVECNSHFMRSLISRIEVNAYLEAYIVTCTCSLYTTQQHHDSKKWMSPTISPRQELRYRL